MSGDFNFYRYVGNSPVNFRDPSGLMFDGTPFWPSSLGEGSDKFPTINPNDLPKSPRGTPEIKQPPYVPKKPKKVNCEFLFSLCISNCKTDLKGCGSPKDYAKKIVTSCAKCPLIYALCKSGNSSPNSGGD